MTRENLRDLVQSKSSSHRVYATQDVTPTQNLNGEPFLTFCTCLRQVLVYIFVCSCYFTCSCHMYPIGYREEAEKSR